MVQKLHDRDLDQVTGGAGVQNGGLKAPEPQTPAAVPVPAFMRSFRKITD
jgi:hypothetical protein